MDIIVVFGSVTSAAYQHLRLAMMRQGLKPKIVRFDKERQYESFSAFSSDAVFSASKRGIDIDSDDPHVEHFIDQITEELANKCFSQVFKSKEMVDSVKAVIFPPTLGYDDTRWLWVSLTATPSILPMSQKTGVRPGCGVTVSAVRCRISRLTSTEVKTHLLKSVKS